MSTQDLNTIFLVLEPERDPLPQFACQFCEAKFDRESSLYGHLNTHRNIVLTCEICQQTFYSLKTYRKHIAGMTPHHSYHRIILIFQNTKAKVILFPVIFRTAGWDLIEKASWDTTWREITRMWSTSRVRSVIKVSTRSRTSICTLTDTREIRSINAANVIKVLLTSVI